ncbi:MAG: hypothetical protein NT051_01170, partial [Candidatus Micrarchaeota archaeon]|nr:hypothetical protein [Candidatus Micrarchaeota archaeon]
MATREETFQTFSEICQRARDIEKKPFSSPPGQIAGSIPQGSESNIFPKETEEYTYAYLLAESQKIERKLSFSSFSPQKTSAPSQPQPRAGEDRKVESELHQLASQKYLYPEKKGAPEQALDDNVPPVFVKQALPSQPKVPSGRAAKPPPSIPISGGAREARILPKPIYAPETPAQTEGDAPGHESEAPLPPVPFPPSRAKIRETPENEEQQLEKEEVPLPPLPQDEDAAPEKTQPLGTAIQAEAPPKPGASKLVLSSKLSPRLRAIIEEKLKREEQARSESENPKLEKEIIPAEKEARPTEERAEQEEPAEKELQAEKEERAEPETPQRDSAPVPVARRKARPEKAQLQDDGPQSISPSEGVQSETSEPKEIPQQEQEPGAAVPASAPAPSQRRPGMVIRPVFKDQSAGAVDIPQAPSADSQKRLLRIQQILGELSSERDSSSPPDELMAELARKKQDAKIKKAQSRASPEPEPEEQPEPKITPMPSKSKKQKEKPSLEKGKQATASKKKTKVSAKKQAPVEQVPEEPSLEEQAPAKLPAREPAPAKAISRKSIQPYPAPPQKEEGESEEPQLQEKSEEQTSPPAQQMRPVPRSNAVPARRQTASPSQAQKTPLSKRQPATAPSQKTKPQRILPGGRLVPSVA